MRAQRVWASPENPRIQTVIRADPQKADEVLRKFMKMEKDKPSSSKLLRFILKAED
jgi:hypothetical protein